MKELVNALKEDWNGFSKTEKFWYILFLPLILVFGLIYGLWLLFWSKYGIAFICAIFLASLYGESKNPDEVWQEAQTWSLLVGFVMIIVQAVRKKS